MPSVGLFGNIPICVVAGFSTSPDYTPRTASTNSRPRYCRHRGHANAGRRIELRGFSVFEVKMRAARNARNRRTGEKVFVPEKLVATFKPNDEIESRMQVQGQAGSDSSEAA